MFTCSETFPACTEESSNHTVGTPYLLPLEKRSTIAMVHFDVIVATIGDVNVSLRFPDESTLDLPKATVSQSTVLRQAISDASTTGEALLHVPVGLMMSWLHCIAAMDSGFLSTTHAAHSDACRDQQVTKLASFLQVSFLLMFACRSDSF